MGYARTRFCAAAATAILGALLAVGAFDFNAGTERWIAFGVGSALLIVVAIAFAVRGRGAFQRMLDLPLVLVCAWAIVCSRAIEVAGAGASADSVKWFSFAEGAAICAFGALGLLLHEFALERNLERSGRLPWIPGSGEF